MGRRGATKQRRDALQEVSSKVWASQMIAHRIWSKNWLHKHERYMVPRSFSEMLHTWIGQKILCIPLITRIIHHAGYGGIDAHFWRQTPRGQLKNTRKLVLWILQKKYWKVFNSNTVFDTKYNNCFVHRSSQSAIEWTPQELFHNNWYCCQLSERRCITSTVKCMPHINDRIIFHVNESVIIHKEWQTWE